jgi:hypothetical protein
MEVSDFKSPNHEKKVSNAMKADDFVTSQVRPGSSQLVLNFLRRLQQLKTEISHATFNSTLRNVRKQFIADLCKDVVKTSIA